MKLIKSILYLLLPISLCLGCTNMAQVQSNWQVHKPKLDQIVNLNEDSAHLVGTQNVLFTVSNDSNNLYIKMSVPERSTQMQIMRLGLNLWLDTTGHKKQNLGITYPLPAKENKGENTEAQGQGRQEQEQGKRDKAAMIAFKEKMLMSMIEMDLIGFDGPDPIRIPATGASGLAVSLLIDSNGVLQYKAIIPLKLMHYHPELHKGKNDLPLSVGLVAGKPEDAGNHYGGAGSHGGSFGAGGMGGDMSGGGGMRGGGGGGRGGNRGGGYSSEESLDAWVHVKLAKK